MKLSPNSYFHSMEWSHILYNTEWKIFQTHLQERINSLPKRRTACCIYLQIDLQKKTKPRDDYCWEMIAWEVKTWYSWIWSPERQTTALTASWPWRRLFVVFVFPWRKQLREFIHPQRQNLQKTDKTWQLTGLPASIMLKLNYVITVQGKLVGFSSFYL